MAHVVYHFATQWGNLFTTLAPFNEPLRVFINTMQDNWDDLLPAAEFACNNGVHNSKGHTPFVLNHGRHPATPLDVTI